jgi:hypothetical protein
MRFAEEWRMMLEGTLILILPRDGEGSLLIENGKIKDNYSRN